MRVPEIGVGLGDDDGVCRGFVVGAGEGWWVLVSLDLAQETARGDLCQHGRFVAGHWPTLPKHPKTVTREAQGRDHRAPSQKEPCCSGALTSAYVADKLRLGTSVPLLSVLAVSLVKNKKK